MVRYLSLLLLSTALLFAGKGVQASLEISTLHPVVKEPVLLTLHIYSNRTDKVLTFDFNPLSTAQYNFKLLKSTEKKSSTSQNEISYTYALFPLKSGKIAFRLHFTYKEATKEEVKKFVTGSADELTYLQTTNIDVPLKPFTLDVSPLRSDTQLVGDFTLQMALDKNITTSDEQINVAYTLKGRGYKPEIENLLKLTNVEIFSSHEHFEDKLFYKELYRYAILSDHNFTLPSLSIKAYSPKRGRYYTLTTDAQHVTVVPDKVKPKKRFDTDTVFAVIKESANYLYFFIGGLFTALVVRTFYRKRKDRFVDRIRRARDPQELLHLLLASDHEKYHDAIETLENAIYSKKKVSLRHLKRDLIRQSETQGTISV